MLYATTLLISVSLTMILVRSKLTEDLRYWTAIWSDPKKVSLAYAINCPQCSGFWVGFAVAFLFAPQAEAVKFIAVVTFGTSLLAAVVDRYLFSNA
jgi:hypothetical protein